MTYLLCLSPILLDQSFPRSDEELRIVAIALGKIQECMDNDQVHLALTNVFRDFIENFDWTAPNQDLLVRIYGLISLLLKQGNRLIDLDRYINLLDQLGIEEYQKHPIPKKCQTQGLIDYWSDEIGKILYLHDQCCKNYEFFIGVACAYGFAGEFIDEYNNPSNDRVFPLVSPDNVDILTDAYEWDTPQDIHQKFVSVQDVRKNCKFLGGTLEKPDGDSHAKVKFSGKRPWTFSYNDDPVPEKYLQQLEDKTSYPLKVIKTILITGSIPSRRLKLDR